MIGNTVCADCQCLHQTSPEQVFWKCLYWSGANASRDGVPEEWQDRPIDYIRLHCHVQPNAPACPMLKPREVSHGAAIDSRPVRSRQPA